MKTQMTIGKKLAACFAATGMLTVILGVSSWTFVSSLQNAFDQSVRRTGKMAELASAIKTSVLTFRMAERGILLFTAAGIPEKVVLNQKLFGQSIAEIDGKIRELRSLGLNESGRQLTDGVEAGVQEYARIQADIPRLCAANKLQEAMQEDADKLVPAGSSTVKQIDKLLAELRELDTQAATRAEQVAHQGHFASGLLIMLALVAGGFGSLVVFQTTKSLKGITSELSEGATQIASAAAQVARAGQTLAQGSSEQAASLEETSASSEEIRSLARKNTGSTEAATENIQESSRRVEDANRHLGLMVASMNEINSSSGQISKIIKVIDEIAFQTNILALNAAVEAARAGEAGMGFAVVADEVRNLSQRCAQAARDTAGLIDESIAKSNDGKSKLDLVASAIGSITESTGKVRTLIEEVNAGSVEQARGVEQVATAIRQMEKVTQSIAANAEESASASEQLSGQSEAVRGIVERLTDMVGASS